MGQEAGRLSLLSSVWGVKGPGWSQDEEPSPAPQGQEFVQEEAEQDGAELTLVFFLHFCQGV